MTTYYIDPTFGPGGSGTSENSPFDAWSDITLGPTDTIYFKRGTTLSISTPLIVNQDGVTLADYGPSYLSRPIISQDGSSQSQTIKLDTVSNIILRNLEIAGEPSTTAGRYIEITNDNTGSYSGANADSNIQIINCKIGDISGTSWQCINIREHDDVTISNCEIFGCQGDAIYYIDSFGINIQNCKIYDYDLKSDGTGDGDGLHCRQQYQTDTPAYGNITISGCEIINWNNPNGAKGCIMTGTPLGDNIIVENCYVSGGQFGISGGATNQIIRNNLIKDINDFGAINIGNNSIVHNNIIDTCYNGITIDGATTAGAWFKFYNNIIIDADNYSIFKDGTAAQTLYIYNNIILDLSDITSRYLRTDTGPTTVYMDNNLWYGKDLTPKWQIDGADYNAISNLQVAGYELNGYEGLDPKLNIDYSLQVDSPCIGAGAPILNNRDYNGNYKATILNDIGAIWFENIEDSTVNILLGSGCRR